MNQERRQKKAKLLGPSAYIATETTKNGKI